ncbi:MAG: hypothetical protein LBN10_09255 [Propionibacteriaceae bacterium]|jgi:hypothetical protein|nr:hypothetical protein [Propionibacteriaceae bacterium]
MDPLPTYPRPDGKPRSKAEEQLIGWLVYGQAMKAQPDIKKLPIASAIGSAIAGGFKNLSEQEKDEFLDVLPLLTWSWKSGLVDALGVTKPPRDLEPLLAARWRDLPLDEMEHVEDNWVHLAVRGGRGSEAAKVVVRVKKFTSVPGLQPKMTQIMTDLPLDHAMLDWMSEALGLGTTYELNRIRAEQIRQSGRERVYLATPSVWNWMALYAMFAYLLSAADDAYLPVLRDAMTVARDAQQTPKPPLRLIEAIDQYGTTEAAHALAEEFRPH